MNALAQLITSLQLVGDDVTVLVHDENVARLAVTHRGERFVATVYAGEPNFLNVACDEALPTSFSRHAVARYRLLDVIQQNCTFVKASLDHDVQNVNLCCELHVPTDVEEGHRFVAEGFEQLRRARADLRAA